jgi:TolB-like protein
MFKFQGEVFVALFAELKRRNVVRVGIAYAVIGWVLAQIAEFAFENFGAPDWVLKSFIVLLLLGLPLALFFAWAFEITPDGIKREQDVDRSESVTSQTGRKLDFLIIGVLALALAYFAFDKFAGDQPTTAQDELQSIAVLPFVNMSDDSDHFADGLTEELLNLLAKNQDLKVAGRTSSFAFKGRNEDLIEIGKALRVTKVLEGSVRRSGERVRITAQLINVADGFHIWSDTYDRELADIFEIQDQVAGAITQALELHLTPEAERLTNNPEAYALYLEAVAFAALQTDGDLSRGIEALDRATALDPQFAKAYELKALFHWMNAGWYASSEVSRAGVYEAATQALAIDPGSPGANSLARISHPTDWSWIIELDAMETLVQSDRSVRALDSYAFDLSISGYLTEAEKLHREVLALDPLSSNAWWRLSQVLYAQGRDAEATQAARKSAELDPGYLGAGLDTIFRASLAAANDEEAIRVVSPWFDEDWFRRPSIEAYVADMRDPETGRSALKEWVEYRAANAEISSDAVWAATHYLAFGYMDLHIEAIDSYGSPTPGWSDVGILENWGVFLPVTGYRKTQHFLDRAEGSGLIELWEHRGPPDYCSKDSGEWVCE